MSKKKDGVVVWLTGLSGAGKSTLADNLAPKLRALGKKVELKIDKQKASASFTLTSPDKKGIVAYTMQTAYVNGDGRTVYTQPSSYRHRPHH